MDLTKLRKSLLEPTVNESLDRINKTASKAEGADLSKLAEDPRVKQLVRDTAALVEEKTAAAAYKAGVADTTALFTAKIAMGVENDANAADPTSDVYGQGRRTDKAVEARQVAEELGHRVNADKDTIEGNTDSSGAAAEAGSTTGGGGGSDEGGEEMEKESSADLIARLLGEAHEKEAMEGGGGNKATSVPTGDTVTTADEDVGGDELGRHSADFDPDLENEGEVDYDAMIRQSVLKTLRAS